MATQSVSVGTKKIRADVSIEMIKSLEEVKSIYETDVEEELVRKLKKEIRNEKINEILKDGEGDNTERGTD